MKITVVGGGPAGMMAAIAAAENNNKVTLIERNDKLGKKLFLTGKGRCNITNACPVEELFDNIVTNPKFMYSAFYDLDNQATIDFFNRSGLMTKTERGARVFPVSDHSSDVIKTLRKRMEDAGVLIMLGTKALELNVTGDAEQNKISGVIVKKDNKKQVIDSDAVIVATGGESYPLTGSDGEFFDVLKRAGIAVGKREPSLVPFVCNDKLITDMQGLSLKNVGVSVQKGRKILYSGFGEMLFTHFGLSGPLILSASAYVREEDYNAGLDVCIDLKPALSFEELDARIVRDFTDNPNRDFANSLGKLLPNKIITAVINKADVDPHKKINIITKQERHRLCEVLKNFKIRVTGNRGFDEAIITRGGVSVRDINPSTMESKKIKGLYFAGEMIDVDALTGGFNLQIAWSTGRLAGICCKEGNT
ncbi:MAG: NAD(P)/FAD-dependent oxidoreductase [Lachnospiraceae bacterium]|nr:NAD(P)/FAD-dependent oxidoreductase [Lachnospiraceae bacterium]